MTVSFPLLRRTSAASATALMRLTRLARKACRLNSNSAFPPKQNPIHRLEFPRPARTSARASLSLSLGQARLPYTEGYKTAGRLSRMLTCLPLLLPIGIARVIFGGIACYRDNGWAPGTRQHAVKRIVTAPTASAIEHGTPIAARWRVAHPRITERADVGLSGQNPLTLLP